MAFANSRSGPLFNPVVLATDFSEPAQRALHCVATVAGSAKVFVVHAFDSFPYRFGPREQAAVNREEAIAQCHRRMQEWLGDQAGIKQMSAKPIILEGDPSEAVREFVRENAVQLVAIGTHGRRGAQRILLGSVAEEILRLVLCPVLSVGPNARLPHTGVGTIRTILFPSDMSETARTARILVARVAQYFQAKVKPLYLVPQDVQSAAERQHLREYFEAHMREMFPVADRALLDPAIVEFAKPAAGIIEFANAEQPDLIVMGVHAGGELDRAATHLPWTITAQVITAAPCPVLTIRA
jgi:nucleotide-binding universal stress UspA family protein